MGIHAIYIYLSVSLTHKHINSICPFSPPPIYIDTLKRKKVPEHNAFDQGIKKLLTIKDLYGETLMLVSRGDSATVDSIRDEIEKHPLIRTEDTSQFYDISVFNHCVQTWHVLLTLECWADVHPVLVTIPVDWDFSIPYGILYQLQPDDDIMKFIYAIKKHINITRTKI